MVKCKSSFGIFQIENTYGCFYSSVKGFNIDRYVCIGLVVNVL